LAELYDSGVGTEKKPNLVVLLYCHFLHPYWVVLGWVSLGVVAQNAPVLV
jgi:hypothetical protein